MATKLFVGSLSWNTTDEKLGEFFAQAGSVVSAKVINDKMTGRSRGFGFVEMSTDEEAQKAVNDLNGKELDGRTITVNEARPQEDRSGGYSGGNGGGQRSGGYNNHSGGNDRRGGFNDRRNRY